MCLYNSTTVHCHQTPIALEATRTLTQSWPVRVSWGGGTCRDNYCLYSDCRNWYYLRGCHCGEKGLLVIQWTRGVIDFTAE